MVKTIPINLLGIYLMNKTSFSSGGDIFLFKQFFVSNLQLIAYIFN